MSVCAKHIDDDAAARLAASVASYGLDVPLEDILMSDRGSNAVAFARQVAMYLCHVGFQLSVARIARAFGRDRSTVSHAFHNVEDRREEPQFDLWIGALEAMLLDPPPPGRTEPRP